MARRIRDKDYGLHEFYDNCVNSFPELTLFTSGTSMTKQNASVSKAAVQLGEIEYQRTMGALFTVYWMLRLDTDGPVGFCYGVDEDWDVRNPAKEEQRGDPTCGRRAEFLKSVDWTQFDALVERAGCSPNSAASHERIVSLLCLTAFHDIMKVQALQPIVQPAHAPYHGYEAGVRIIDHDVALAYVLEHYPGLLPSNAGLDEEQQRQVLFTQGKMHFNHGWFVQGEAPPGGMLSTFKRVLSSGADQEDIEFYFLHWLTDLAGAEATPLGGTEKLVLKMPRQVLSSFLWSMPYLSKLSTMSETELVESYLCARWRELAGSEPPFEAEAIAVMRLAIMTQGDPPLLVVEAFSELPAADQACLLTELSRTGCNSQTFSRNAVRGGPAFLIYYSPALLQRNNKSKATLKQALHVLAVVLRGARAVWPMTTKQEGLTVTIMIGELKASDIGYIVSSPASPTRSVWVLQHQSSQEGVVSLRPAGDLNTLHSEGTRFHVLDFCACVEDTNTEGSMSDNEDKANKFMRRGGCTTQAAYDIKLFKSSQCLLVFMSMGSDGTQECALLWLIAALNRRETNTTVDLVLVDSEARYQWMAHVFDDNFVQGGEWALTQDRSAFIARNVMVRMWLAHSPSRETNCIEEILKRGPGVPLAYEEYEGKKTAVRGRCGLLPKDVDDIPGGNVACIMILAPIPDVRPQFFSRFSGCRRSFVLGTPGGVNCPMPRWVDHLAALREVAPVIYLTPDLTRAVRFPRNYVLTNPTWPEIIRRDVWEAVLTCLARRPEIPCAFGSWGLVLRLNAANATFCREWYHDITGDCVDDVPHPADLVQAVDAYVERNSGDDRRMGEVMNELGKLGVDLHHHMNEAQTPHSAKREAAASPKGAQPPEVQESIREAYKKELFRNAMACVMTTERLIFQSAKNQKACTDDAGFERLIPRCGYAEPLKDLSRLFGADDAIALLMQLPIRWLTPAYDVVGMVCGERALEEGGEVDGGLGLVFQEAGANMGVELLSEEQRKRSDNPILMTPAQSAFGVYGAGPFS